MRELEAFAILASIPNMGAAKIRLLLRRFGTAEEAVRTPASQIYGLPGFERIAPYWDARRQDKAWQCDLELVAKHNVKLIPFTSPQFPQALLEVTDHPAMLYVRGELKSEDLHSLAIVGTRQASIYGMEMADSISQALAANRFTIVSGLARGIDTAAHRGALRSGRTLAVIGSGLADIYPPENAALAEEIAENGALISEFPMATPPDRQNFPQRNRIVSGMTMGTVLIEAPIKSGAMITMDRALLHKRQLFALPGRADNDNFRGNHLLIKTGKAHLVENASDIMAHYAELFAPGDLKNPAQPTLDKEELTFWEKMPNTEISIDELSSVASLPIQHVQRILMGLILKKVVKEFPGKLYKKLAAGAKR